MAAISTATSPLYTAQHPGWNYEPISYAMDELPAPLPARTDRLPWERKELAEQEKQNRQITETQRAYDAAARQKARGGFLNNLSASVKPRFAKWRNTPMPVREAIPSKRDERKFNNKFHFPSYERLLYASELCKTISGTQQILGKVFVSENFFCFRESRLQPKGGRRQRLNLVVPLDDILSISQAEISSQPDPKYAPDFRVLDQWHAKADGIFLYARDFKVHRFFGFWTQQTYHDTFNVLDRQWRSRPYTSTAPLRAGETGLNRSMVPPVRSAAPSVAVLEPAQFQPYSGAMLGSSGFAPSRMSTSQYTQEAPMTSSWRGMPQDQWRGTTEGFSGKQAQSFPSRTERRTLPRGLSDEIRNASTSRLRHVATPVPKYGHVISDMNNRIELVPLESLGSGIDQQRGFGLASQGRQFRTSQYAPKRWNQELPQQRSIAPQQRRWSTQGERPYIPDALSNEIRHWDKHNLHHINAPQYQPAGVPLGHVIERRPASFATRQQEEAPLRRSSWDRGMQQRQTGFVPRERLGFQTVQQQLHTQQRGRSLNPQLRDEIHFFNLRSLRHVRPTVRQWMPQARDIKMRPAPVPSQSAQRSWEQGRELRQTEKHGERKRHHHHKHHKASQQGGEPVQVFQYEEFDLTSPSSYERVQVTKLQEQLSRKKFEEQQLQQGSMQQRLAAGSYEAGTA